MELAMEILLRTLLKTQNRDGSFNGGADNTSDLSTALGAVALINIGRDIASRCGLDDDYDRAVATSIKYLIDRRKVHETRATPDGIGYKWSPGVFFSASGWSVATWKSEAYTVAITLEALTKYALEFDRRREFRLGNRSLVINRWRSTPKALARDFAIQ
jgi:hypothetical protein